MKKILSVVLLFSIIMACKNGKKEGKFDAKSYEQVKESLAEKEKNSPAKFLVVSSHDRKNLIGQTVVIGTLSNRATVCWYKDVQLHLSFFSKTGVRLDEGMETIYENIGPGQSTRFKTKYFAPKGTNSVAVAVVKATADITHVN